MKKILFVLLMLCGFAYGQVYTPMQQNYEFKKHVKIDSSLNMAQAYSDTSAANTAGAGAVAGRLIRIGNDFWMRNTTMDGWLQFVNTGSGATSIQTLYTGDGSLTSSRVVTISDPYTLKFQTDHTITDDVFQIEATGNYAGTKLFSVRDIAGDLFYVGGNDIEANKTFLALQGAGIYNGLSIYNLSYSSAGTDSMLVKKADNTVAYREIPSGGSGGTDSAAIHLPDGITSPSTYVLKFSNLQGDTTTVTIDTTGMNIGVTPGIDSVLAQNQSLSATRTIHIGNYDFNINSDSGAGYINFGDVDNNLYGVQVNVNNDIGTWQIGDNSMGAIASIRGDAVTDSAINITTPNLKLNGNATNAVGGITTTTYTKFVGLLSQTGTSNPTITVLENTTGYTFTCTRSAAGDYDFAPTSGTPFTANKTWVSVGQSAPNGSDIYSTTYTIDSTSNISVNTSSLSGGPADDILGHTSIEIRIYP